MISLFSFKSEPIEITLPAGIYQFECWGAQSSEHDKPDCAGKGAYTKGTIRLNHKKTLYLFIGEMGKPRRSYQISFNGGGSGQYGGGGATDIRTIKGDTWDDFESLKSRIMVAAGGGGPDSADRGGAGGTIIGLNSLSGHGKGATQTSGGQGCHNGKFGQGGSELQDVGDDGNGGGGAGYYGGGTSSECTTYGAGGGSSFISGYPGCNAVDPKSTDRDHPNHLNSPFHYSGLFFTSSVMIPGNKSMPSPNSESQEIGHSGNGAIRIQFIDSVTIINCKSTRTYLVYMFVILFVS